MPSKSKKPETKKSPASKKSPAASQSTNSASQKSPKPPVKKTSSQTKPKKSTKPAEGAKSRACILLEALLSGAAVASTVDGILQVHEEEGPDSATCAVVNMVCMAAGVQDVEVDAETITQEAAIVSTLEELYARVPVDSQMYLFINKDAKYKRFKKALPDFFERLVLSASAGDKLYDEGGVSSMVQWLAAMGTSKARSFRHTSTVALLSLTQGIASRLASLKESLQSQKKKEATQTQKAYEKLLEFHDTVFNNVVQRSKDVAPEIRTLFTLSLRTLCVEYPSHYITNAYLRCFAVPLYDKKSECRLEGYSALVEILGGVPAHADAMRDFFKYFAKRIVDTCNDAETKVADLAIRLCSLLIRTDVEGDNIITTDMLDRILLGLFDERSSIRSATGTFFKLHLRGSQAAQATVTRQTELLCAYLATLHEVQDEPLAERYVVDALWRNDNPPQVLTCYEPFLHLVKSSNPSDCSMGLRLIAAILNRLKEPLSFGPAAKDDMKSAATQKSTKKNDELDELPVKLSKDVGAILSAAMEKHLDSDVLSAACEVITHLDLNAFASTKLSNQLRDVMSSLTKGAAMMENNEHLANRVLAAYRVLAFTEHPNKSEAEGQLHELLKQVLKQISQTEKAGRGRNSAQQSNKTDVAAVWARVRMITSLVALKDQWGLFKAALTQHTLANASPALLSSVAAVAFQGIIWLVGEAQLDPSIDPETIGAEIADVVAMYVRILEADTDDSNSDNVTQMKIHVFVYLSDLCSLPHYTLPQAEQESMVNILFELIEVSNVKLRQSQDSLRAARPQVPQSVTTALLQSRKQHTFWEAAITKVSISIVRLFVFKKFLDVFAPRVLLIWTRINVRVACDSFKSLFHTLRDRNKDSFALEKNILLAGFQTCAEVGMNPPALEAFYQVGLKLASMHFLGTDRFYPACVAVVQFGVEYAETTDPAILQAIQPYCSKLRQVEAIKVVNSLNHKETFTQASNPFVRSFIVAIRRAAKMEDAAAFAAAATPAKRQRDTTVPPPSAARVVEEDALLAEVVAKAPRRSNVGATPKGKAAAAAPGRVEVAGGWRVRADEAPVQHTPATSQRNKRGAALLTQNTGLSSLVDDLDNNEVFIATQEYL